MRGGEWLCVSVLQHQVASFITVVYGNTEEARYDEATEVITNRSWILHASWKVFFFWLSRPLILKLGRPQVKVERASLLKCENQLVTTPAILISKVQPFPTSSGGSRNPSFSVRTAQLVGIKLYEKLSNQFVTHPTSLQIAALARTTFDSVWNVSAHALCHTFTVF